VSEKRGAVKLAPASRLKGGKESRAGGGERGGKKEAGRFLENGREVFVEKKKKRRPSSSQVGGVMGCGVKSSYTSEKGGN